MGVVHAAPEELTLADEPITDDEPVQGEFLELQRYMPDLESGRLLVFEGERADLEGIRGVRAAEVARIKLVQQVEPGQEINPDTGGKVEGTPPAPVAGRRYTLLQLEAPLAYAYRRSTVQVHGNVVWATHGETRDEVLGNADASRPWQSFALRQVPVTRLPAPTAAGSASTLTTRVDRVRWREVLRLREAGPTDRVYVATTDDAGRTTVTFGDGRFGARPPSGAENVRAYFRVGTGTAGNVQSGQIILLTQPPPGAHGVTNPLAADGGSDPEGTDRARRNAPLGTLTLGRVVSVRDYAAFARTFAGIGKAESVLLTAGHRRLIQVTVAGSDDLPLPPDSDLLANLTQALARNGTARLPFRVDPRERVFVFLRAGVRLDPDYLWEDVRPDLRRALVREFPFEHRGLGRSLYLSEVVAALQHVPGVEAVEVDYFFGVEEMKTAGGTRTARTPEELQTEVEALVTVGQGEDPEQARARQTHPAVVARPAETDGGAVRPAQIAYFGPETLDDLKAAVSFWLVRT
jgi:hypothetical protein